MRIAVVGDIHANAQALRLALNAVHRSGCDQCVLLGDLLTYGIDVTETLDLVSAALVDPRFVLLRGNHDAMYSELLSGRSDYAARLPDWIRDSVEWTLERLEPSQWRALPLRDEWVIDRWLFSHANPYGANDWRYLNSEEDYASASECVASRGLTLGVFGHTHRARAFSRGNGLQDWTRFVDQPGQILAGAQAMTLNAGSPGQPREREFCSAHMLWLEMTEDRRGAGCFQFEALPYDQSGLRSRVLSAGLSERLISRLNAYHHFSTAQ